MPRVSRLLPSIIAVTLALAAAAAAQAATITRTYNITASGFGFGAPFNPVSGSFTVTWDNSVSVSDVQTGITGSLGPVPLGSALAFTYDAPNDQMGIGGVANSVAFALPGTNDYIVYFDEASATPVPIFVLYTGIGDAGTRTSTSFTITLAPTAVPEPASILLLTGAVGALGWGRRRAARRG